MKLYPSRNSILAEFARKKGSKDKKKRKRTLSDNLFGTTTAGKLVRGGLLAGGALVAGRKFIPRKPFPGSTAKNPVRNLPASGGTSGRSYVKQEKYRPGYKPNFVEQPVLPPLKPNPYLDKPTIDKNVTGDAWADPKPRARRTQNELAQESRKRKKRGGR